MMPFEVEYWYSSAFWGSSVKKRPGPRARCFVTQELKLLFMEKHIVINNRSMTWLRSAWVLITSVKEPWP